MSTNTYDMQTDFATESSDSQGWHDPSAAESWPYSSATTYAAMSPSFHAAVSHAPSHQQYISSGHFVSFSHAGSPVIDASPMSSQIIPSTEHWHGVPSSDGQGLSYVSAMGSTAYNHSFATVQRSQELSHQQHHASGASVNLPESMLAEDMAVARLPSAAINVDDDSSSQHATIRSTRTKKTRTPRIPNLPSEIAIESDDILENGRAHELYSIAERAEDGCFHCPFENDGSCTHAPTKLKCNYDKYLDSHLRPYTCAIEGCEKLRFSSVACRLRHEREAHGEHGHGKNPYLCKFKDCERSQEGKGFPRSWNCQDHMKRVHHYDQNETSSVKAQSPSSPAFTAPPSPVLKATAPNSRKRPAQTEPGSEKKQKKSDQKADHTPRNGGIVKKQASSRKQSTAREAQENFRATHRRLHELVHRELRPNDDQTLNAIKAEADRLLQISLQLQKMSADWKEQHAPLA